MLTKSQKSEYRSDLFRHLDGIVFAPTAYMLYERGILQHVLQNQQVEINEISKAFDTNEGYLNVALRMFASQGWLDYELDNEKNTFHYSINEKSPRAFELCALYKDVHDLLKISEKHHPRKFEEEPFRALDRIFENYYKRYDLPDSDDPFEADLQHQVLKHIEGICMGPTIVSLGMNGMFHKYFMEASFRPEEFHSHAESFSKILDFFSFLGWYDRKNGTYSFTEKGLFFAKRATAYGVTVSYLPNFKKVEELIFGNPTILRDVPQGAAEKHVDREMNVWGSGGAHSTYFKKVDEIIISIFNRPIEEQPKGIVDMGCGNGAFLQHIFEVIELRTLRGEMLEEYPLFLVGADYNEAALKVTRSNLIKSDIWAKVIFGDIGRPDLLADDLKDNYGIDLGDLLNVRTFLDHNRIWETPNSLKKNRISSSSGTFAHRGKKLSNNEVEDNLLQHFNRWAPYVRKFGLLVIELHTISPSLTAQNIGRTAATAYDATHGFSDQYIVEIEVFNRIAAEAGLFPDEHYFSKFPNSELATVSINLLKG